MNELLPCPFCGGKPKWEESTGGAALEGAPIYRVQCSECFRIDMPWWSYRGDCIEQWNARAPQSSDPAPTGPMPDNECPNCVGTGTEDSGNAYHIDGGFQPCSHCDGTGVRSSDGFLAYLNGKAIQEDGRVRLDISFDELKALRSSMTPARSTAMTEPVAWIDRADNGNIRFWTYDVDRAERERATGRSLHPYTMTRLVSLANIALQATVLTPTPSDATPQSPPPGSAPHNSGERLPNSDVATSGGDTRSDAMTAAPATDAVREAIKYLRDVESHMMEHDIDTLMGDYMPPSIIADRLEAALSSAPVAGVKNRIGLLSKALVDISEICANAGRGNEIVAERVIDRVEEAVAAALALSRHDRQTGGQFS